MKKRMIAIGVLCALAFCGAAFAEQMPVVTDEPLTEEEALAAEAERMRDAQQMLIDLGLLDGVADGIYGPRTALALKTFQQRNGLVASGELNDATLAALREKSAMAREAREIQQRLIDLGYLRGTADGIFGDRSVAALRLFQTMAGLDATGAMDDATREALFADDARALPARLSGGDKGEAVEALQQRLIQLGFLSGKADGDYGKGTAAAVRRFQSHLLAQGVDANLGIEATGEATSATQALLFDPEYSSYICDLMPGDTGDEVLRVERRLSTLGYMDAEPDETFDDYAARAAAAFKVASGLGEDGAVDRAVVDALFAADVPQAETFVPHAIAKGDKGLAVSAVEETLLRGGMTTSMPAGRYNDSLAAAIGRVYEYLSESGDDVCRRKAELFADSEALSLEAQDFLVNEWPQRWFAGNDSATIRRVQSRLHTLYYLDRTAVDGTIGEQTRAALTAFQSTNNLPETGETDVATRRALFSTRAVCKQLPYRVEVSLDEQRVYVYELTDSGKYEHTQTFVCSTGLGNLTPRGIFLDGYPVNHWHYFQKFDCWAKYSFEIEGNIMFHSVIYSSNDDSTLRKGSVYALGSKASHGCIRLPVKDAKWLFTHCKRGSLVIIIY